MVIRFDTQQNIELATFIDDLKAFYPDYSCEFTNKRKKKTIIIDIDSKYAIVIKQRKTDISVYYEHKGCLVLLIPITLLPLFRPESLKHERQVAQKILDLLRDKGYNAELYG